jgi:peptide deformylase
MLQIVTGKDHPVLRTISMPVQKIDKHIVKLIDQMIETMKNSHGVGLAAPQVGKNIRLFVMQTFDTHGRPSAIVEMINPQIIWKSDEEQIETEGCLSLPGQWGKVKRPVTIKVSFMNKKSVQQKLEFTGINARIVQHENDHLDGILFIDKVIEMVSGEDVGDVRI